MTTLVVLLEPRVRQHARNADAPAGDPERGAREFDYLVTNDGLSIQTEGRCAPALLPKAATVVAVLADNDVSWHRIDLPRAPAARLRDALNGLLEESLLDEDVHLALAPNGIAGQPVWVAAVDRGWLAGELATLERARVFVDRVVPVSWPDEPPTGHFSEAGEGAAGNPATMNLSWAHADGVTSLRVQGGLARVLLPDPLPASARWSATPAAAAAAGAWINLPVAVMPPAQRALQATRSLWNLRQFGLSPRHRGARALRDALRRFRSPPWRPFRVGAVGLIAVQLIGLNLWAWHQRSAIADKEAAMVGLLRTTFPQVRAVLDAPVQMQRETDTLRLAAGKAAETDLEPMLHAAASAWPVNRPPVESLRYEPGRLSLAAAGWANDEVDQFRAHLQPSGWQVDFVDGRLNLSRVQDTATAATAKGS